MKFLVVSLWWSSACFWHDAHQCVLAAAEPFERPLFECKLASSLFIPVCTVPAGMLMATITALAGPAIEVFLIAKLDLYSYSHPTAWGIIPTWIPWVYFCGSPAVGNLGRKIKAVLHAERV